MPRPRFSKLDPARRQGILQGAAEEFGAHGYQHASLNRIIATLGLNKGVFYYYFDGKADLFSAVVDLVWEAVLPEDLPDPSLLERDTFWQALDAMLREAQERVEAKPWLAGIVRLMMASQHSHGEDSAAFETLKVRGRAWANALLQRGQEVGEVRRDLPLDLLLDVITAADQAADRWLAARWDDLTPEERAEAHGRTLDLWRRLAQPAATEADPALRIQEPGFGLQHRS